MSLRGCRLGNAAGDAVISVARDNARLRVVDLQNNEQLERASLARRVSELPQLAQLLL